MWILSIFLCFDHGDHGHCQWKEVFSFTNRTDCIVALHDQNNMVKIGQHFGAARCAMKATNVEK